MKPLGALLLFLALALAGCGPSEASLPEGVAGGPPLPRNGASLRAIRAGRAAFEAKLRPWLAAREQWIAAEREAEIAYAQAWLHGLALVLAAVGLAFAVASIWLAGLRSLVLYVTGLCLSAALGLYFLAMVWPWFWLIALGAGLLALFLFGRWAWKLREAGLDWREGFAILSGSVQEAGSDGRAVVQAILDRLAKASRLNRGGMKALRDNVRRELPEVAGDA